MTSSWNSAVFKTLQSNQYAVLVVTTDFVSSETFVNKLGNLNSSLGDQAIYVPDFYESGPGYFNSTNDFWEFSETLYNKIKTGLMVRIKNSDCMRTYAQSSISDRMNLFLVTNKPLPSFQLPGNGGILNHEDSTSWTSDMVGTSDLEWVPGQFVCSENDACQ